jgi:hypothetical protein
LPQAYKILRILMTYSKIISAAPRSGNPPSIGSYDLGYEYSQEHYVAVQCMIEDADNESLFIEDVELDYAV